jgi:hypothetical protein
MVDLMMWLVIAALLLAAAIQGIGYYQRAAFLYQLQSDTAGAGSLVMSSAAENQGSLSLAAVEAGVSKAKWSRGVSHAVMSPSNGGKPYISTSHTGVGASDAVYLFEDCAPFKTGVNVISKTDSWALADCGIQTPLTSAIVGGGTGTVTADFSKDPEWIQRGALGVNVWYGVAISSDGMKMATAPSVDPGVGNDGGRIRTSTDGGATWKEQMGSPYGNYRQLVSSADGSFLVAGQFDGYMYISKDSGSTWTEATGAGIGKWYAISLSGDGKEIFASSYQGYMFVSHDYGSTWNKITNVSGVADSGRGDWYSNAMSGGGKRLIAAKYNGYMYTSDDYGTTWTEQTQVGTGTWVSFAASSDGTKLAVTQIKNATAGSGKVLTSTNFGATWTVQNGAGIANWRGVSMSSDGTKILAGQIDNGSLMLSTDSGLTWKPQTGATKGTYYRSAISPDGTKMIAGNAIPQTLFTGIVK